MKAIKDTFNLWDWKDQYNRDYETKNDHSNDNKRYYPELFKLSGIWETLESEN
jgi:hypothetical protein